MDEIMLGSILLDWMRILEDYVSKYCYFIV